MTYPNFLISKEFHDGRGNVIIGNYLRILFHTMISENFFYFNRICLKIKKIIKINIYYLR